MLIIYKILAINQYLSGAVIYEVSRNHFPDFGNKNKRVCFVFRSTFRNFGFTEVT